MNDRISFNAPVTGAVSINSRNVSQIVGPPTSPAEARGERVFVVHGRDADVKARVVQEVERVTGTRPIVLHEQSDGGRTIIEKLERDSDFTGFAVALLTADDVGCLAGSPHGRYRARQNVVFETGFFMGRLGRRRVMVIADERVERPSELDGLVCTPLDAGGQWVHALERELRTAGFGAAAG